MDEKVKSVFLDFCKSIAPSAHLVFMNPKEAVFEECVKMNCFYCGKYGRNWRCPPNLPNLNYPKMFSEYDEGLFVYYLFDVSNRTQFESIRSESSVMLHKTLLNMEKWLIITIARQRFLLAGGVANYVRVDVVKKDVITHTCREVL